MFPFLVRRFAFPAAFLALFGASAATAQTGMPGMASGMPMGSAAVDQEMMKGMAQMQHDMAAAPVTGDPDKDFVAMMLPHHQGAVDMAETEMRYGRDPAMRRLAGGIIQAQKREIAEMRRWQQAHPVAPTAATQPAGRAAARVAGGG
jgi:uncharacterized protein (DUF305 family)